MKRKTAMKKLMGTGLRRNEAADVLFLYHEFGLSNRDTVFHEEKFRTLSLRDAWDEMGRIGLFPNLHVSLPETMPNSRNILTPKI